MTFRQWRQAPANRIGLAIALWLATAGSLWSPATTAVAPACLQAVSSPMDVLRQGGLGGVEEIANDGSGAGMPAGGGNAAALAIFRGCPCAQPPVCRLARPRF